MDPVLCFGPHAKHKTDKQELAVTMRSSSEIKNKIFCFCVLKWRNSEVILGLLGTKVMQGGNKNNNEMMLCQKRKERDVEVKGGRKCRTRGRRAADEFKPI